MARGAMEPRPARPRARRLSAPLASVAALTALGAVLRFATLDLQSFWYDEAVTVELVRMDLGGMLERIPDSESTPPLYYVLAWGWAKVLGTGEAGLRSLSALLGTATVPVAYAAGSVLCSRRAGVAVAALAAVNPLLVWYSQEARAYALLALLGGLSLVLFARALRRPGGPALALWAAVSALALATHYFALFLVVPEAAWLLAASRPRRRALAATPAVAAAGAALLPLALHQESLDRAEFIRSTSLAYRAARVPKQYLLGFDSPLEIASGVVAAAIALAGLALGLRRLREPGAHGLRAAAALGGAALALPLVLALAGADYLETRNLVAAWLPLAVVLAAGLTGRAAGRAGVAGVLVLCALGVASVVGVAVEPTWQRQDWRGLARSLGPPAGPRALVVSPGDAERPLEVYLGGVRPPEGATVAVRRVAVAAPHLRRTRGVHPEPPPRPPSPPAIPGFELARTTTTESYTVFEFRAPAPVALPVSQLASYALRPGNAAVLVQRPG